MKNKYTPNFCIFHIKNKPMTLNTEVKIKLITSNQLGNLVKSKIDENGKVNIPRRKNKNSKRITMDKNFPRIFLFEY